MCVVVKLKDVFFILVLRCSSVFTVHVMVLLAITLHLQSCGSLGVLGCWVDSVLMFTERFL